MTKTHYIYILKDENGNPFYVGQTINPKRRRKRHIVDALYSPNRSPVKNKLKKVLVTKTIENIFQIIENSVPEDLIDEKERYWINSYKLKGFNLKNLTSGGRSGGNFTTQSTIDKIRKIHLGAKRTEETKKKISQAKLGVKFSNEHKQSLKDAWKTRLPLSKEHYQKISKLNRGKINIKQFQVQSPSGEVFITETGLTDFCRKNNLSVKNLHKTLSGQRPHHKGWKIIGELT